MNRKDKSRKTGIVEEGQAWETRYADDPAAPLAENSSGLPDRASAIAEGSPGESEPIHASGYQNAADAAHPQFPDQGPAKDEGVRRRAYELWEAEGRPEDADHERRWLQAERELRGERD